MVDQLIKNLPVFVFSPKYNLDLGEHVFPALKFGVIHDHLLKNKAFQEHTFVEPTPVTFEQANLAHNRKYLKDLIDLKPTRATAASELPLRDDIVQGFFLGSGGTLEAARLALQYGAAINLSGGFHHAFRDKAEGFCYLNDVAIATKVLQQEKKVKRVLIIDLDVHQGNGTARIFRFDRQVFTFSMHEEKNYPKKEKSNLDISLNSQTEDVEYLQRLSTGLVEVEKSFQPDLIFYLAGVDPFEYDKLGGLSLTFAGMRKRDEMVRDFLPKVPRAIVLAGGYALNDQDTVDLHLQTCEVFSKAIT